MPIRSVKHGVSLDANNKKGALYTNCITINFDKHNIVQTISFGHRPKHQLLNNGTKYI